MRVLVTGGAGFIGSHTVEALLAAGHRVRVLVQPGDPAPNLAGLAVEPVAGDIRDPQALARACAGVDAVLHLAAVASDWAPRERVLSVNREGTRALIEAAQARDVRRLVLVSTLAVHAASGHLRATEDTPRDRVGMPYAEAKRAAEDLVLAAHRGGRIEGVVVRPGLVPFGPRDQLFSAPLCRALRARVLPLIDGGRRRLCTSYVENLAAGLCLAATHPAAAGETFVLADPGAPTWRDLFGAFADALGLRVWFPPLPGAPLHGLAAGLEVAYRRLGVRAAPPLTRYRVDLMRRDYHFVSERAARLLGYSPQVPLAEGVARTVAWVRSMGAPPR